MGDETPTFMNTPRVGDRIATHLTLRSILGTGGSATVFEAFHERLDAPVAVKVSMAAGPHAGAAHERLLREARLCARLDDPRVVRVYDIAELEDGRPYFVMERVTGTTVSDLLVSEQPELSRALDIIRQLLKSLSVAHAKGIVHGDIKPENLILQTAPDGSENLRLLDFGIARTLEEAARPAEKSDGPTLLGTPGYMAPERIGNEPSDGRADVYAAGIVLYELVSGRLPMDETDPMERLYAALARPVPDVRGHAPDCPAEVAQWIARATAQEPDERFASAVQARNALTEILREYGELDRAVAARPSMPEPLPAPTPETTSPSRERSRSWLGALVGAGAVAAAVALLRFADEGSDTEARAEAVVREARVDEAELPDEVAATASRSAPRVAAPSSEPVALPLTAAVALAQKPAPDTEELPEATAEPRATSAEPEPTTKRKPSPRGRDVRVAQDATDAGEEPLVENLASSLKAARSDWAEALQMAEAPALGIPTNPY